MPTPSYDKARDTIIGDPSCSFWLRDAIRGLENRDPVDAVHDAECLCELLTTRLEELLPPLSA
jgi:hypothetical protein